MANEFSVIQKHQASTKFFLVRMEPRFKANSSLSDQGSGVYTMSFSGAISTVKRNGVTLTKVDTVSSNDEWSINESTNTFTIKLAAAPSSTNTVVVNFYLFYTESRFRVVGEDPESTSTLRDWEAKISTNPNITQSIENIFAGILSISSASIVVINDNLEFNELLSANHSFYRAPITIWSCLDSVDNIQKAFEGFITGLNFTDQRVTIRIEDNLSVLAVPALMNDSSADTVLGLSDYPSLDTNQEGLPIRMYFGSTSRYKLVPDSSISGLVDAKKIVSGSMSVALNNNFSNTVSTTTNRNYICGRTVDGTLDFSHTPTTIDNTPGGYTILNSASADVDKFLVGDTLVINDGGVDRYTRVIFVDKVADKIYCTKEASVSTGDNVLANAMPTVSIKSSLDNSEYFLLYGRDYTASSSATTGGHNLLSITLEDNFEANHAGLTAIDPGDHSVYFRIRPDTTNALHGSVVKKLLESAGLTVNAASVTTANSALSTNANFSIPQIRADQYSDYTLFIERLIRSTIGALRMNNDFEVEYVLFDTPSSTDETTDTDIIKGSFNTEIQYKDIVTKLISFNPHFNSSEQEIDSNNTPFATAENESAKYLHGIENIDRFEHYLERMDNKISDHINVLSERRALFQFRTKTPNLDSLLSDDLKLSRTKILGTDTETNVSILSISKKPGEVSLICSDLYNL
jgi:hypothetical protein